MLARCDVAAARYYTGPAMEQDIAARLDRLGAAEEASCRGQARTVLARIRAAVADDRTGAELEKILRALGRRGFERGGDVLRTSPRGYAADHPRIDLLRHKSLVMRRSYGFDDLTHSPALLDQVRKDWRAARPLVEWVARAAD